jgi:hypothetical protein
LSFLTTNILTNVNCHNSFSRIAAHSKGVGSVLGSERAAVVKFEKFAISLLWHREAIHQGTKVPRSVGKRPRAFKCSFAIGAGEKSNLHPPATASMLKGD